MMSKPMLQLAVDVLTLEDAIAIIERVYPHFDIIEVGTPLVIEEGLRTVEAIKTRWPDKQVLADLKIMDAGHIEATSGFSRGSDIVTVLGVADDATIRGVVTAGKKHGGQVMADLINTTDPAKRAAELAALGVDILCVHTAYDVQGAGGDPLAELHGVRAATTRVIAIAGGLKLENSVAAIREGADIVVVGGTILKAADPAQTAADIMAAIAEAKS